LPKPYFMSIGNQGSEAQKTLKTFTSD
jgi:hypothetical protein